MELIRQILLNVEEDKYPYGASVRLDDVSYEVCAYHAALIFDAELAEGEIIKTSECPYADAMIHRLTARPTTFWIPRATQRFGRKRRTSCSSPAFLDLWPLDEVP